MSDQMQTTMTEDEAAAEALLLMIRKMRRLHSAAFWDMWAKLPDGAKNALTRAEARADGARDDWRHDGMLDRPAWPDEFDTDDED